MNPFHFNGIVNFVVESSCSLGGFALIYMLFLRKETHYGFNRGYLFFSLIFSLLLPLVQVGTEALPVFTLPMVVVSNMEAGSRMVVPDWVFTQGENLLMPLLYIGVSGILLCLFILRLVQLLYIMRTGERVDADNTRFVLHGKKYTAFSFFQYIFISKEEFQSPDISTVIIHEKEHVRQWHSIDILFLEMLLVVCWLNPFLWIYRHFFKENHEFSADRKAINHQENWKQYAQLLLGRSFGLFFNDFPVSFNTLSIQKRITMMKKNQSGRASMLKALLAVPVVFFLVAGFAFKKAEVIVPNASAVESSMMALDVNPGILPDLQDDKVYKQVKHPPEYPGGQEAMVSFMVSNIKYPEECKKSGKEGTVYVTFVVDKKGAITHAKVLRGVHLQLDTEALRVVNLMPAWKAGYDKKGEPLNVEFVLPIKFKLD